MTGGALVRLMTVIWVVVVALVVGRVGGAIPGFSTITGGLSGRVGGPNGGGGGTLLVVFEGGRRGCLPGDGAWSLGFGAGGEGTEGVLRVVDGGRSLSSPVSVGERARGGVGPTGGRFGSCPLGGPELGDGDGRVLGV